VCKTASNCTDPLSPPQSDLPNTVFTFKNVDTVWVFAKPFGAERGASCAFKNYRIPAPPHPSPHRTAYIRPKKINPNTSSHFLPVLLSPLTLPVFIFSSPFLALTYSFFLHLRFEICTAYSFVVFVHSSSSFFLHSTCIVTKR
jgi:hypothetical protein